MESKYELFNILWKNTSSLGETLIYNDKELIKHVGECDSTTMTHIYIIIKLFQVHTQENVFVEPYNAVYMKEQKHYKCIINPQLLPQRLKNMISYHIKTEQK